MTRMMLYDVNHTKYWKAKCILLDVIDYLASGNKKFLKYILQDLEELKEVVEDELNA